MSDLPYVTVVDYYDTMFNKKLSRKKTNIYIEDSDKLKTLLHTCVFTNNDGAEYFISKISPETHFIDYIESPWNWSLSQDNFVKMMTFYGEQYESVCSQCRRMPRAASNSAAIRNSEPLISDSLGRLSDVDEVYKIREMVPWLMNHYTMIPYGGHLLSSMAYILMHMGETDMASDIYVGGIGGSLSRTDVAHEAFSYAMHRYITEGVCAIPVFQYSIFPTEVPIGVKLHARFVEYIRETVSKVERRVEGHAVELTDKKVIHVLSKGWNHDTTTIVDAIRYILLIDETLLPVVHYVIGEFHSANNIDTLDADKYLEIVSTVTAIRRYQDSIYNVTGRYLTSDTLSEENKMRYSKLMKLLFKETVNER